MPKMDDRKCKDIIKFLARKLGADPKLIVTRLMSEDDKNDMRNGDLPMESLECHIKVWMEAGCPDYVNVKYENSSVPNKAQRDEP